jgi:spore coat polysaccharide biosynthesis protein SpsF
MMIAMIQARMTSTRLPGKILCPMLGRPMLSWMIERVKAAKNIDAVVLLTSTDISDDPVADFCREEKVDCYRGSLDDVLDRYYQAACLYKSDHIIRLTGDCPLIDPRIIDEMVDFYESHQYEYIANSAPPPGTFPDGMDVEICSFQALERAWREADKPSQREHVTFYFWQNPDKFCTFRYDRKEDFSAVRLTVDYPEDFNMVNEIYTRLYPQNPLFSMDDILTLLKEHPALRDINQGIKRNQGWESAFQKDRKLFCKDK